MHLATLKLADGSLNYSSHGEVYLRFAPPRIELAPPHIDAIRTYFVYSNQIKNTMQLLPSGANRRAACMHNFGGTRRAHPTY